MSTDALELALALHQAPIQRFALRDRPLPANIDDVLQLASAMQPQLRAAALRFSESEDTIVEAVRFYLHQVLFESGTDAYRFLGLAANADIKRIREHHIWLQRWLHPDRRGEDWEAALATKINWAWQQLRNESSRQEYDRSRQKDVVQNVVDSASVERVQPSSWRAAPIEQTRHWLRRLAIGSVLAVCAVLVYLAATRQDRVDPDVLAARSMVADSEIRPRLPFVDEATHRIQPPDGFPATPASAPNLADSVAAQNSTESESEQLAHPAPAGVSPEQRLLESERAVGMSGKSSVVQSSQGADQVNENRSPPAGSGTLVRTTDIESAQLTAGFKDAPRLSPRQRTSPDAIAMQITPTRLAEHEHVQHAQTTLQENTDTELAQTRGVASAKTAGEVSAVLEKAKHSEVRVAASPTFVKGDVEQAELVKPDRADIKTPVGGSGAATPALESTQTVASVPSAPSAELDRATLRRLQLARAHVRSMVTYFSSTNVNPADWNDEPSRHAMAHEREVLHQRNGVLGIDRFVLDPPVWQISHSAISLKTRYHIEAKRKPAESGRFRLDMVWADGNWKISHIELSPGS